MVTLRVKSCVLLNSSTKRGEFCPRATPNVRHIERRGDTASESFGRVETIEALTRKSLWLASWMVHHANHIRPNIDGVKVDRHKASSASMAAMLSTRYFGTVKPHAAPAFHAI